MERNGSSAPALREKRRVAGAVDAVIISSQHHERTLAQRALVVLGSRGVPVLTIDYTD
jgi:hypothetical protein